MVSKIKMKRILIVVALNARNVKICRLAKIIVTVSAKFAKRICVFVSIERLENLNIENPFVSAAESCKDNIKNQDETDIDCGGNKCPKCEDEKICHEDCDCLSRECKNNTCAREYSVFQRIMWKMKTKMTKPMLVKRVYS
jgi:hypothetical protein